MRLSDSTAADAEKELIVDEEANVISHGKQDLAISYKCTGGATSADLVLEAASGALGVSEYQASSRDEPYET